MTGATVLADLTDDAIQENILALNLAIDTY